MPKRLQRRHLEAIREALDSDIVARRGAMYDDMGERIEVDDPEDDLTAIVPAQEEALAIVKERLAKGAS